MSEPKADFEAADKFAATIGAGAGIWDNLARCYRASRERERRREALVRGLIDAGDHVEFADLVEAARKELGDAPSK